MANSIPGTPVVHIGPSNFARGCLFPAMKDVLPGVGVTAISLRSSSARDRLQKSGFEYRLFERRHDGTLNNQKISNIEDIIVRAEDRKRVIDVLAADTTEVVTLTITPKGYVNPKGGFLDLETGELTYSYDHPDPSLARELQPECTGASVIAAALYQRYLQGKDPFILMSLDNMNGNTTRLKELVSAYATATHDPGFVEYVEGKVAAVDTMVDRIVPGGTDFDRDGFLLGYNGPQLVDPVCSEPFPMAAIVMGPSPDHWFLNGLARHKHVLIGRDVAKYSEMKIRMLNGAHFALGMVGRLSGYDNTHEAMENPAIREFMVKYVRQMQSSLKGLYTSIDTDDYAREVIDRISFKFMDDPLLRLARDSSSKLLPRLLEPLRDLHLAGKDHDLLDQMVIAWTDYIKRAATDPDFHIEDPGLAAKGLEGRDPSYYDTLGRIESTSEPGQRIFEAMEPFKEQFAEDLRFARGRFDTLLREIELARQFPHLYGGPEIDQSIGSSGPGIERTLQK